MPESDLGKSIRETGPQSPGSMYEALKYIVHGPNANGSQDSAHLKAAANALEAHHKSMESGASGAARDLGVGK